jgi:hypothetical protein
MKRNIILIFLISLVLNSCQISGLTSGYSHLSRQQKTKVIDYKGNIEDITDNTKIYTITVKQVKDYILSHEKVLVYDYTPYCKSQYCCSPNLLVSLCERQGIKVLVIANVYDDIFKRINNGFPLLMINTKPYSKWRWKYTDRFYYDLIGYIGKDIDYASFHYFINGTYIKSFKDFKDIGQES